VGDKCPSSIRNNYVTVRSFMTSKGPSSSRTWRTIAGVVAKDNELWTATNRWLTLRPVEWIFVGITHEPWRIPSRLRLRTMLIPLIPCRINHYEYSNGLGVGIFDLEAMSTEELVRQCENSISSISRTIEAVDSPSKFLDMLIHSPSYETTASSRVDAAYLAALLGDDVVMAEALGGHVLQEDDQMEPDNESLVAELSRAFNEGGDALMTLFAAHREKKLRDLGIWESASHDEPRRYA
jgi:hypothetical protein